MIHTLSCNAMTFEVLTESKLGEDNVLGMFDIDAKKQIHEIPILKVFPPEVALKFYHLSDRDHRAGKQLLELSLDI
ncbi:MAG: hypothetical protein LVT47_13010 [Cyanobacteria bacterium LVE1205-1]|jgi:hypothetical protein